MKTTLVIMAAGIGSRYGAGVKQLAAVGPNGELIIDYSIHDAIAAGFRKIIFIIRKDIEKDFREVIGDRIEMLGAELGIEVAFAFQAADDLPAGMKLPEERTKPWGTGQAVLACRELIHEPFAVINADDYYGKEAFIRVNEYLHLYTPRRGHHFCMAGFILKNTLSDNGAVTRGICTTDEEGYLSDITETHEIVKTADGAAANGKILDINSLVSMNMWGLTPEFIPVLEKGFTYFLQDVLPQPEQALTAEYLLPDIIGRLLRAHRVHVRVLKTDDQWFGVTYQADRAAVAESFRTLTDAGVYNRENLFADL